MQITSKLTATFALVCALGATAPAQAQINLDFTTANVTKDANSSFVISNITYQGKLYDVKLQWNPYDVKFDIAGVAAVSGTGRVCNLGNVSGYPLGFGSFVASVTLISDANSRSISVSLTSAELLSSSSDLFASSYFGSAWTIVQNGREVITSIPTTSLTSTMAPVAKATASTSLSWTTIPASSLREATISSVPTYIDLSSPLTKVVIRGKEYACK